MFVTVNTSKKYSYKICTYAYNLPPYKIPHP
jgi:hypothetical protein